MGQLMSKPLQKPTSPLAAVCPLPRYRIIHWTNQGPIPYSVGLGPIAGADERCERAFPFLVGRNSLFLLSSRSWGEEGET